MFQNIESTLYRPIFGTIKERYSEKGDFIKMETKYNATVIGKIMITPDIMVLRVNTDTPRAEFESGQYTVIGLYGRESRSANSEEE